MHWDDIVNFAMGLAVAIVLAVILLSLSAIVVSKTALYIKCEVQQSHLVVKPPFHERCEW